MMISFLLTLKTVKNNLKLGPSFFHLPTLEDYWANCFDEFEVRRRNWMRFSLRQIVTYGLDWDVQGIEDDESDLFPIFIKLIVNWRITTMDWSSKETETFEAIIVDVLERTQEWVTKKNTKQSCPQTKSQNTQTTRGNDQPFVIASTFGLASHLMSSRAQGNGDEEPPNKNVFQ